MNVVAPTDFLVLGNSPGSPTGTNPAKPERPFRRNSQAPLKKIELAGGHRNDPSGHGRLLILIQGDSQPQRCLARYAPRILGHVRPKIPEVY